MNIIQILHGNLVLGGMEKFSIDLSNELSKKHKVALIADSCFKPYISPKVIFIPLDIKRSRYNLFFLIWLYKVIKNFNADIVHVHKQKSIQIIKMISYFTQTPFIATKHDTKRKKEFLNLEYAISISDDTAKTIKAKQVFKIYNGIPLKIPKKTTQEKDIFKIVAVGGLKEVKCFDELILSVSKLKFPYHLTILGDGILKDSLKKLIRDLQCEDTVSLLGFKDNVEDYLFNSDLQIISSKAEGFSLAMIEGIFYSKVLISTKVSGCIEILPKHLLFDIKDLSTKITDIYFNQNLYQKHFEEVKAFYKNELSIETCAKKHISIYAFLLKKQETPDIKIV